MKEITAVLLGAGQRGAGAYAPYALENPGELHFVAVAEPDEKRRREFQNAHNIDDAHAYADWETLLAQPRMADAAMICTQDRMHFEPTIKALESGYHVLLEKPMSTNPAECITMGDYAKKYQRVFSICHVLRYTPFFSTIKQLIDSGTVGKVLSIQHAENVAYWHQAHSYVRGNWRNTAQSSPMLLAKSCHDLDVLLWLAGSTCVNVSSFGHLSHFKAENAPEGAPARCMDGCPHRDDCPYYAPKIYGEHNTIWQANVIRKVVSVDTSPQALLEALRTGPYGRCVYHCDNDVVDHQVVNMDFANGCIASFTMNAFTYEEGRTIKIMGTEGEISGRSEQGVIEYVRFNDGHHKTITLNVSQEGHGGGDYGIIKDFVELVRQDGKAKGLTSAELSVQSHVLAFAAEQARLDSCVVNLSEFTNHLR